MPDSGLGVDPQFFPNTSLTTPVDIGQMAMQHGLAKAVLYQPEMEKALGIAMSVGPGIFGGQLGAEGLSRSMPKEFTNKLDSLDEAQNMNRELLNNYMAGQGKLSMDSLDKINKHVFEQTGWYRGIDNQWRFVIPDEDAAFEHGIEEFPSGLYGPQQGKTFKLPDIIDHPELFEAYPFLKDVNVRGLAGHEIAGGLRGQYNPSSNTIKLGYHEPVDLMSTLLHEVQHVVQYHENFARGGSVNEFRVEGLSPAAAGVAYRNLAGEVEARNVQRFYEEGRSPTQFPPEQEEVPPAHQVVRFFHPSVGQFVLQPVEHNPFGEQP